jgi:hypothetical protein
MRNTVSSFAITLLLVGCFQATQGEEAGSDQRTKDTKSVRQYTVDCRIASDNPKELSFAVPKVTVRDGEKASISDTSQRPFAVAAKTECGVKKPITQAITEGTTIEMTVRSHGDDKAILDLTVELSSARDVPSENGQSVRVNFEKGRVIECVSLGKKVTTPMRGWSIEVVVKPVSDDGPAGVSASEVPAVTTETSPNSGAKDSWRLSARVSRQRKAN